MGRIELLDFSDKSPSPQGNYGIFPLGNFSFFHFSGDRASLLEIGGFLHGHRGWGNWVGREGRWSTFGQLNQIPLELVVELTVKNSSFFFEPEENYIRCSP